MSRGLRARGGFQTGIGSDVAAAVIERRRGAQTGPERAAHALDKPMRSLCRSFAVWAAAAVAAGLEALFTRVGYDLWLLLLCSQKSEVITPGPGQCCKL